jgi:anti-anti-sigma factor
MPRAKLAGSPSSTFMDASLSATVTPDCAKPLPACRAAGVNKELLNLEHVDFVDSSGIGEIVKGHMTMRKQGGHLKLACLTKPVSDLLQATSLNKVFDPDEESALKSFESRLRATAS